MEFKDEFLEDRHKIHLTHFVNKHRCIPCFQCKTVVLELKDDLIVTPGEKISLSLFKDSKYNFKPHSLIICPICSYPLIVSKPHTSFPSDPYQAP